MKITHGDFANVEQYVDDSTFVYLDPPYRPLNNTSSFTSYSSNGFDDNEQIRLANFFDILNEKRAKLMLSNSDPKIRMLMIFSLMIYMKNIILQGLKQNVQ